MLVPSFGELLMNKAIKKSTTLKSGFQLIISNMTR